MKLSTQQIIETNALACLECGKCTGVCPVSRFDRQFSPRRLLMQSVRDDSGELLADYDLWSCLTCKRCDAVCPSDIKYSDLTRFVRNCAADSGFHGKCSHSGAMDMLQKIMTKQELNQNRLDWVGKDLNISQTGEYLYFVGCAPYFDVFFDDLNLNILASARSSIKILNRLGISPVLMPDERCCG
ncbi:MAG: (Fe-S)-binding protein, partial [Candidatus Neomarinimicrobiota bacterium]